MTNLRRYEVSVLYAEDERALRKNLKYALKRRCSAFFAAADGETALDLFKKERPDVVICDILLPKMNGIEFAKKAKEIAPKTEIIFYSNLDKRAYLIEAIELGAAGFVAKSLESNDELLQIFARTAEKIELSGANEENTRKIELLSAAVEQSSGMIAITDLSGRLQYANKAFVEKTGFSATALIGKRVFEDSRLIWEIDSDNGGDKLIKTDKGEIWIRSNISPIMNADGSISNYVIVADDISDKKKAEEAFRKAEEAKNVFLANMSHELRTPLNGVIGATSLLLQDNPTDTQREYLEMQSSSAEALLAIINNILDFSKIDAGAAKLDEKEFSLKELLDQTVDFFRPAIKTKNLEIHSFFDPKIPKKAVGDRRRLRQVLTNVVGNAVKFTQRGHIEIFANYVNSTDGRDEIEFVVKDTGIGIPEDKIDKIFERFTQADSSYTRRFGGAGLGLALAKEIVELLGGSISAKSKVGVGTTIRILVKFKKGDERKKSLKSQILKKDYSSDFSLENILVVEDNLINQKIIKAYLENKLIKIDLAANGIEAVEAAKRKRYDAILMDIEMAEMNGLEAAENIRKNEAEELVRTPILAVTAHTNNEMQEKCLECGMDGFIIKPIDFSTLISRIRNVCRSVRKKISSYDRTVDIDFISEDFGASPKVAAVASGKFAAALGVQLENYLEARELNDNAASRESYYRLRNTLLTVGSSKAAAMLDKIGYENGGPKKRDDSAFASLIDEILIIKNKLYGKNGNSGS